MSCTFLRKWLATVFMLQKAKIRRKNVFCPLSLYPSQPHIAKTRRTNSFSSFSPQINFLPITNLHKNTDKNEKSVFYPCFLLHFKTFSEKSSILGAK